MPVGVGMGASFFNEKKNWAPVRSVQVICLQMLGYVSILFFDSLFVEKTKLFLRVLA